jgi:hypothetical protein
MQLMRIGTWNLKSNGRIEDKKKFLLAQNCDVWLLTEVCEELFEDSGRRLAHFNAHWSSGNISEGNKYAAVLSAHELEPVEEDMHFASAAATIGGITYCSSVLPWLKAHIDCEGWIGKNHAERTQFAIESLLKNLPKENLVWGGDWNHSLVGSESSGSDDGRRHICNALREFGLRVPTEELPYQKDKDKDKGYSIDHIAVPNSWSVKSKSRIDATGLSDHDAYVVEVSPP